MARGVLYGNRAEYTRQCRAHSRTQQLWYPIHPPREVRAAAIFRVFGRPRAERGVRTSILGCSRVLVLWFGVYYPEIGPNTRVNTAFIAEHKNYGTLFTLLARVRAAAISRVFGRPRGGDVLDSVHLHSPSSLLLFLSVESPLSPPEALTICTSNSEDRRRGDRCRERCPERFRVFAAAHAPHGVLESRFCYVSGC